ncbi:hypothetical protein VNO78_30793 [Psophocarpus tetragonolobus]|uniref:Uncharacterized protein n=1 Tax=Psophocarpus tetragonolobus TaxID=3891 RepID=A0AAN9RXH9_PSOTE
MNPKIYATKQGEHLKMCVHSKARFVEEQGEVVEGENCLKMKRMDEKYCSMRQTHTPDGDANNPHFPIPKLRLRHFCFRYSHHFLFLFHFQFNSTVFSSHNNFRRFELQLRI